MLTAEFYLKVVRLDRLGIGIICKNSFKIRNDRIADFRFSSLDRDKRRLLLDAFGDEVLDLAVGNRFDASCDLDTLVFGRRDLRHYFDVNVQFDRL